MRKDCTVSVNTQKFAMKRGDILLDAGLARGIDMPHDCRSGHCGTCQVTIAKGITWGGECGDNGVVRACQARVITDLEVVVEPVPDVVRTKGVLSGVRLLAPDVVELRIGLVEPVSYLPGQYYKFSFRGYPWRCYSPTAPMGGGKHGDTAIHLHVRRVTDGHVSAAFGERIKRGHSVTLEGPFGHAYLRSNRPGRLVLVSSGTGFAPIWSIVNAALSQDWRRRIVLIVGAKSYASLYMGQAMRRIYDMANITVIPVAEEVAEGVGAGIRRGRPTDHMPPLSPDDIVYACGAPKMVDAVSAKARACGAMFYADPFVPQGHQPSEGVVSRAVALVRKLVPAQGQLALALPHPDSFRPISAAVRR